MSFVVEKLVLLLSQVKVILLVYFLSTNSEGVWSDYIRFQYQQPLLGIAVHVLFSSGTEFVCFQSPFSTKGLFIGIFFVVQFFFI